MANILVAEDDLRIRRVLVMWLSKHGHAVVETGNGKEAMEVLSCEQVDLLITDIDMPLVSGMDLVAWWRDELNCTKPVLMFTASCDIETSDQKMSCYGIKIYSKPFSPPELMDTVERMLSECETKVHTDAAQAEEPEDEAHVDNQA